MAFLSLIEIVDIIAMTLIVGYIFIDGFRQFAPGDSKQAFLLSILAVAPGIILHEFGHKIVGLLLGFDAIFNAAYTWLILGIVLKFVAGFVFFVPAYVSISCSTAGACAITPLASVLIAFAGPLTNGLIYIAAILALKYGKWTRKQYIVIAATKKINGILFVFNMLPIPLFDGFKVYQGLWALIFG